MPKEDKVLSQESQAAPGVAPANSDAFAPASYELVNIDPTQKNIHIPILNREYVVEDLKNKLDVLEYLERIGWPHVKKS